MKLSGTVILISIIAVGIACGQFVDFTVTTATYEGQFRPSNCYAVWITDQNNNFKKTLMTAALTPPNGFKHALLKWVVAANWNEVDAVSGATSALHGVRTVSWDCTDTNGTLVPDGNYRLHLEMTETNSFLDPGCPGAYTYIPFRKGLTDTTIRPQDFTFNTAACTLNKVKNTPYPVFKSTELVSSAPGPGILEFSAPAFSQREGKGTAFIKVARKRGKTGAVGVNYAIRDSSARAGAEYTAINGSVTFANNDFSPKTIQVPLINDAVREPTKTAVLTLSGPTGGAALGTQSQAVLYIFDDDNGVPDNGMMGHWDFEEPQGTSVIDGSGNGNNGLIYLGTRVNGKKGKAVSFATIDGLVDVANSASLSIQGPITVACWVSPRQTGVSYGIIGCPAQYTIWMQPDNQLRFADALGHYVDASAGHLPANTWKHVAGVFSGVYGDLVTASNLKLYVNGNSVGVEIYGAWVAVQKALSSVTLGTLNGIIDEAYIYNRALSQAEIQTLYRDTILSSSVAALPPAGVRQGARISPNPFKPSATVFPAEVKGPWDLRIFDSAGKLVYDHSGIKGDLAVWNTGSAAPGVYVFEIETGRKKQYWKGIKIE